MTYLYNRTPGLVSVVISTYNYGRYILGALNGLKKQTYSNIEVIIVDDCSTDNTERIIQEWCKQNIKTFTNFMYLKLPRNATSSWALNIGFIFSKGEYIVIHDSDDISHENKIQRQIHFLNENPDFAVVGTGFEVFQNNIKNKLAVGKWICYDPKEIEKNYKEKNKHCVSFGTIMFRATILEKIIGIKKNRPNDKNFIRDIVHHNYRISNLKEDLFYVRKHQMQHSRRAKQDKTYNPTITKKIKGRVSVILPVKNSSKTILCALESIASQTYQDMEIIIVDDTSDDNTEATINNWYTFYKVRNPHGIIKDLIYFKLPRPIGSPWAYNIASYLSRGEYIAFHSADGISTRDRIEKQVGFLNSNPGYSGVGTNFNSKNKSVIFHKDVENCYTKRRIPCVNMNTIMLRSSVIDESVGINGSIIGKENFEFIYRLLNTGFNIENLDEVLYSDIHY